MLVAQDKKIRGSFSCIALPLFDLLRRHLLGQLWDLPNIVIESLDFKDTYELRLFGIPNVNKCDFEQNISGRGHFYQINAAIRLEIQASNHSTPY